MERVTQTPLIQTAPHAPLCYELRLQGHLGQQWAEWFAGATIVLQDNGETVLTCAVPDQAALHGLFKKVRDVGIPLLSVTRLDQAITQSTLEQTKQIMKAIVYHQYGSPDVLTLAEVAKPTPKANEVLIKVHAVSLNAADWHMLRGDPFPLRLSAGLTKPKNPILGADVAGVVEAVGGSVTQFRPGDAVFGDLSGCGFGGLAEYVCAPENVLVIKPTNLTFEQAAAVPMAALTALHGLRDKGQLRRGQKVAINGASGGVGTFAVQIAKALGAEVTAVCSTKKMDMVRALGADHVIDYTRENFTQNGQRYDLILAANGYHPIADYQRALNPNGTYVMTGGTMAQMSEAMLWGPWLSLTSGKKMGNILSLPNQADLAFVKGLIEAGQITPVIDKCYPLHAAAEAMRYVEQGHASGKVVITHEPNSR